MSKRGDAVQIIEQLELGGGVSVIELHRFASGSRANVLHCRDQRSAGEAIEASRALVGAEVLALDRRGLDRPCPRCRRRGDPATAEDVFGFRVLRGRRVRQSWCRECRGQQA